MQRWKSEHRILQNGKNTCIALSNSDCAASIWNDFFLFLLTFVQHNWPIPHDFKLFVSIYSKIDSIGPTFSPSDIICTDMHQMDHTESVWRYFIFGRLVHASRANLSILLSTLILPVRQTGPVNMELRWE